MSQILGAHSPSLDAVRALRTSQGRREQRRFAVEGPTMLAEALAAGRTPIAVYATAAAADANASVLGALSFPPCLVGERAMARISDVETPSGIVAVLPLALDDLESLLSTGDPALVLAGIADPGNAGTLVRSAEIFGIRSAVFARPAVDPHNGKVIRATMGAIFRIRLCSADPEDLLLAARQHGYAIVAATKDGARLPGFRFPSKTLLAIGNERRGVAASLPRWDFGVTIPQRGAGESLNAAVAGGIILYTFSQQYYGTSGEARTLEKP
jgi:TrmH family RNA methyltransferase